MVARPSVPLRKPYGKHRALLEALWLTAGTTQAVRVRFSATLYDFFRAYVYSIARRRNVQLTLRRRAGFVYLWVEPRR